MVACRTTWLVLLSSLCSHCGGSGEGAASGISDAGLDASSPMDGGADATTDGGTLSADAEAAVEDGGLVLPITTPVAAGTDHALAIGEDGTLWAWGYNASGQLGDGSNTPRSTPTAIGTSAGWVQIEGGSNESIGLQGDGSIWTWGAGFLEPALVEADVAFVAIAMGDSHWLAISIDGALWGYGGNSEGQLGNGTIDVPFVPGAIGSAATWIDVAAGQRHSLGVQADRTLWSWGENSSGHSVTRATIASAAQCKSEAIATGP